MTKTQEILELLERLREMSIAQYFETQGNIAEVKTAIKNATAQILSQIDIIKILIIAGIAITAIIGIIILLNQRKIRKELRQLREMMENQDKPQE